MPAGSRVVQCGFLGCVPYPAASRLQAALRDAVLAGGPQTLLLLEHPPVVTFGRNARRAGLLVGESALAERGVELHETDRGGLATFHGPGQLVGYPILDLRPDRRDARRYVRDLEEVLVRTLADLGLPAEHSDRTRPIGVWVGARKVASIGVHLKRWVTSHGFALNLTTDLSWFGLIDPCGLGSATMTSVAAATGRRHQLAEVARIVTSHFAEVFACTTQPLALDPAWHAASPCPPKRALLGQPP